MKYRRKTVEIEAIQCFGKSNFGECLIFCNGKFKNDSSGIDSYVYTDDKWRLVKYGDFIIRDIKGGFHVYNADYFLDTYEEVQ